MPIRVIIAISSHEINIQTFISNGTHATMGLIAARTDKNAKAAHGISLFLVDTRDHPGFKKGKTLKKIGQPTYDTAEVKIIYDTLI